MTRRPPRRAARIVVASAVLAPALVAAPAAAPAAALVAGPEAASVALPPAAADEWRDRQYWLEEYGFREAWETSRGEGVTVAVIDTGIDADHPDLAGQVVGGTDVSGAGHADGTQPLGEMAEHGTMVASVLAGHGNNEEALRPDGIIGVAPEAELLSISVHLGATDPQVPSPEDQIAEAVTWAVDHGADVINMSLGSTRQDWPESWDRAFLHAEQNDVVVVAAAGNRASGTLTAGAPATIPGVLTVAGLNPDGTASWDSSTEGISIGVAAPADPLVGAVPGGGRRAWQGTSGAAPLVSGLAALVQSAYPEMPAPQVIHRILATARDAGVPGEDPVYGHGIIDAAAALTADVDRADRNPMDSIAEWIRIHRRASSPSTPPSSGLPGADPSAPASSPDPVVTALPEAAPPGDPAPGLQPALVVGTAAVVVGLLGTGVVLAVRRRQGR